MYFHLGRDATIWETNIHAIGKQWGYHDDEIDGFLECWKQLL
jgi:hypothetical protein